MIERGMLTSNHTSQNATSPEICFGQTMKVCLFQHSTAFWHPFKTFRLSSSWRPASLGFAMLLESRRSSSCYPGGSRKYSRTPRRRHGWKRNLQQKIKLEADPIGGFIAPIWKQHLCNVNFPAQIGAIVGCSIGGFKLRKGVRSGRFDSGMMVYWDLLWMLGKSKTYSPK